MLIFTRFKRVIKFKESLYDEAIHDDDEKGWNSESDDCFEHSNDTHHLTSMIIGQIVLLYRLTSRSRKTVGVIIASFVNCYQIIFVIILLEQFAGEQRQDLNDGHHHSETADNHLGPADGAYFMPLQRIPHNYQTLECEGGHEPSCKISATNVIRAPHY